MEQQGEGPEPSPEGAERKRRLDQLFDEWLEARERGPDVSEELLARAGDLRAELEARLRVHHELRAFHQELGLGQPAASELVGRFQILKILGSGGSSVVYLARDPQLGRRIALKVLKGALGPDERTLILNEARSLAKLDHSSVVQVYEVGESDGTPWVAMELLTGPSLRVILREWIRQRSGVGEPADERARELARRFASYTERLRCLVQLGEALAYCHDHGVLHRDIKPENVLFDATGTPKLLDFGLAHDEGADEDSKLNLTQSLVGTPAYVAPEQVTSGRAGADPLSDQFVFATLVYECFALENPFLRPSRRSTLDAIEAALPPPLASRAPAVAPDLAVVVGHAHERDPEDRYSAMAAMIADLQAVLDHRPISVRPPSLLHGVRLWTRRHHRGVRGASAALTLALVSWSAFAILATSSTQRSLLETLRSIRPGEFEEQLEFESAYEPLKELQGRAASFDSSFLSRALWGPVGPEVEQVVLEWSHGLHELFVKETEELRAFGASPEGLYPRLFFFDLLLCPHAPWNEEARRRGMLTIQETGIPGQRLDFYRYGVKRISAGVSAFGLRERRRTPRPELGTYHILAVDPENDSVWAEAVVFMPQGWPPEIVLKPHPRRPEFDASSLRIPRGRVPIDKKGDMLEVLEFSILDHLVTNEEFNRYLTATGRKRLEEDAGRPARVSYDKAMAFAAWAGGRLPALAELHLAKERVALGSTSPGGVSGEYLLDFNPLPSELPGWLEYSTGRMNAAERSVTAGSGDSGSFAGFRLVFSDAKAGEYRRLARESVIHQ